MLSPSSTSSQMPAAPSTSGRTLQWERCDHVLLQLSQLWLWWERYDLLQLSQVNYDEWDEIWSAVISSLSQVRLRWEICVFCIYFKFISSKTGMREIWCSAVTSSLSQVKLQWERYAFLQLLQVRLQWVKLWWERYELMQLSQKKTLMREMWTSAVISSIHISSKTTSSSQVYLK